MSATLFFIKICGIGIDNSGYLHYNVVSYL